MDPKAFDHLDPKLKETYARVMGTPTPANDAAQTTPVQPAQPDALPAIDPNQSPLGSSPFSQAPVQNEGPNPGTGPTINTMPADTSLSSSPTNPTSSLDQTQSTSPANSTFFSNPSPSITEPSQPATDGLSQPVEPPTEPSLVTPYTPEDLGTGQSTPLVEPASQPFPSPSSVNQAAPHEASSLLRVLYIVGAVIFFIIYTIFWIKVFGLPLPFFS